MDDGILPNDTNTLENVTVLYLRHRRALCRYARSIVESSDGAEDVVQEVFRRIIERAGGVRARPTRAYLYKAVRNEALNWIARRRVRRAHTEAVYETIRRSSPSPDDELDANALISEISNAVDRLPPRGRQAFLLVCAEGRSYMEAAKIMGISPETLKVHLRRARQPLRKRLAEHVAGE